jgi:hypothetical protein
MSVSLQVAEKSSKPGTSADFFHDFIEESDDEDLLPSKINIGRRKDSASIVTPSVNKRRQSFNNVFISKIEEDAETVLDISGMKWSGKLIKPGS